MSSPLLQQAVALEAEVERLKAEVAKLRKQTGASLNAALETSEAERDKLKTEVAELRDQCEQFRAMAAAARETADRRIREIEMEYEVQRRIASSKS